MKKLRGTDLKRYVGEIGLLAVALMWGMGFVASDVALNTFTPYQVMMLRFLIAAVIMSMVFFKKILQMDRKHLFYGAILGTILYISFILQTVGLKYTTPSKNAFLTAVNVIIVPFIGFLLYRRKVDKYGLAGAFLACLGIGCLSWRSDTSINIGDVLTLICAVGYAFHIFFTGEFLKKDCEPAKLMVVQMVVAFLWALLVVLFKGEGSSLAVGTTTANYYSVLFLGIFSTCAAFLLQTLSQKRTTETKAAVILSMESFFGTLFSVLILKERLTTLMTVGCLLILSGVITAESKLNFFKKTGDKL